MCLLAIAGGEDQPNGRCDSPSVLCLVLGYAAAALLIAWQQPVASSDPTAAPPALSKGSAHSQERLAVGAGDPLASGNAWGDDCFRRGWTTQPLW